MIGLSHKSRPSKRKPPFAPPRAWDNTCFLSSVINFFDPYYKTTILDALFWGAPTQKKYVRLGICTLIFCLVRKKN
jgi:hypothetical protein